MESIPEMISPAQAVLLIIAAAIIVINRKLKSEDLIANLPLSYAISIVFLTRSCNLHIQINQICNL
jgi:hypothetical protein